MQLNGIAHVQLTVTDLPRSRAFWKPLLGLFEMKVLLDTETYFYCIGSRTGVALSPIDPKYTGDRFDQRRVHGMIRGMEGIHQRTVEIEAKEPERGRRGG